MLPNLPLHGVEEGSNVLILNTIYTRPKKISKGNYTPDKLYVVYRDLDTKKKKMQLITNPTTDIYITKKEHMNDFNTPRESMPLSQVDRLTVPYKDRERELYKLLSNNLNSERDRLVKATIDRAMELGKWNGRKEVHKWRHAYYSDYDIEDYIYTLANLYYKPKTYTLTKSYLDIETDIYGRSKYDQENGACPIHAVTLIYDYAPDLSKDYKPKVFTLLLRDHKRYKQQKEFEENLDEFMDRVRDEFDEKYGEADYNIMFFDDDAELLYNVFKIQHIMKPDFTNIWNMSYDILYKQKRAQYLGIPPEALFCHPDFKDTYMYFKLDERNFNDPKNRGDAFTCLSYTKYIDQMNNYAARRKGGQDYGSNSLDNIANIELGAEKRRYDNPGVSVINGAIEEYANFVLYSMNDVWLQVGLDRKVEDTEDIFVKGYESGTKIDKANRQTVSLKNLWAMSYFQQDSVMGNNLNTNYLSFGEDDDSFGSDTGSGYEEILKGALVGDPSNLNNTGAEIYEGKKSDRLFLDAIDLDFGSMYPNIKLVNNIARSTQYGRLILIDKISPLEYSVNPHLRGGEFVEDYETGDWLKIGIKWFSLKRTDEYIREFITYSSKNRIKIKAKKLRRYVFYTLWSEKMTRIFSNIFPDKDTKLIESFLMHVFNRDIKDVECIMYNNYEDIEYTSTLLSIIDWIKEVEPIMTESGTFFKRHEECEKNPGLMTINNLLTQRKVVKNMELEYELQGKMEEAKMCNLRQNRIKIYTNSEYGSSGNKGAFSYNFHSSQSVTSKGQTLISLAMTTFEDFISDTMQFYDIDELLHYCDNIVGESITYDDSKILDEDKSVKQVKKRLLRKCKNIGNMDESILDRYLSSVSQSHLNRLYYKSNLFEFIEQSLYIQNMIREFSINTPSFLDPNNPPKSGAKKLKKLTDIILEYCQYNYPYYGRIDRLVNVKRNSVIIIDTDSNIICVHDLKKKLESLMSPYRYERHIVKKNSSNKVKEARHLKAINTSAFILTQVITRALSKFEEDTNAQNHPMGTYVMKNEFYFSSCLVSSNKKTYLSLIRMREGSYFEKPRRDVKGYNFKKISAASKFVRDYIEDTLFTNIVTENINIPEAIRKFIDLEDIIRESLLSGSKDYHKQSKVSTMDSYKDPMGVGSFKAAYIWNRLYPNDEIEFPNSVNLVKVKIKTPKDIAELALEHKDMFEKLCELLKDKNLKTGITQIAVPLDSDIPDWLIKCMDVETMVNKNLSLVVPILEEIGIRPVYRVQSDKYLSNIIQLG